MPAHTRGRMACARAESRWGVESNTAFKGIIIAYKISTMETLAGRLSWYCLLYTSFIASVEKINRELGVTVLMADHRLEEILPLCSRAVVLDKGSLLCDGTPRETGEILRELRHPMFLEMPTPVRVHASVQSGLACPLTVREGRQWLREYAGSNGLVPVCRPLQEEREKARPAVSVKDAWFRYEKMCIRDRRWASWSC